jgi:hypothetical protein
MREDMHEVLLERPRGGWRGRRGRKGRTPRDPDLWPRFESTSRNRGGTKWLSENLAPLRRFLGSRVGRPWSEVHSEIAARLRVDSAVQKHVLDHLRHMVETHAVLIDGRPFYLDTRSGELTAIDWSRHFYVCPVTGVLSCPPPRKQSWRF